MAHVTTIEFRQLVDDYYESLYRFAWSLAKNPDDAADLTQQTFAIFAKKGHTLRDTSKVKSWLFTSLYREFLRQRRKDANATFVEPEIIEATASEACTAAITADSHSAVAALQALPDVYREPLTLFYLDCLSYKEIADLLDIPIGTVMSRLSRGKSQLRDQLMTRRDADT